MTHRNVEIWRKRLERMQRAKDAHHENANMAYRCAAEDVRALIERNQRDWLARWHVVAQRVWHALCVAEGWRKA